MTARVWALLWQRSVPSSEWAGFREPSVTVTGEAILRVADTHTFRKIRLRYIIHTGTKQTAVKLTE
jgi:hypothetical protein